MQQQRIVGCVGIRSVLNAQDRQLIRRLHDLLYVLAYGYTALLLFAG